MQNKPTYKIENMDEYRGALKRLEQLARIEIHNITQSDELEILTALIKRYEGDNHQ